MTNVYQHADGSPMPQDETHEGHRELVNMALPTEFLGIDCGGEYSFCS